MTTPDQPYDFTATRAYPLGPPAAPVAPPGDLPPTYGPPPPPPPRRTRTGLVVGLVLVAVVLLAGSAVLTYSLLAGHGSLAVPGVTQQKFDSGENVLSIEGDCSGLGYGDIRAGTQAVLTDEKQTVLAAASLVAAGSCRYTFRFKDVPAGRNLYGITISHRGTFQVTESALRAGVALGL